MGKNVLGQADHGVKQSSLVPVAKIKATILAWLGSSAGLAVVAAVSDVVDQETVVGALVAGGLASLAGYLKRAHVREV